MDKIKYLCEFEILGARCAEDDPVRDGIKRKFVVKAKNRSDAYVEFIKMYRSQFPDTKLCWSRLKEIEENQGDVCVKMKNKSAKDSGVIFCPFIENIFLR